MREKKGMIHYYEQNECHPVVGEAVIMAVGRILDEPGEEIGAGLEDSKTAPHWLRVQG